MIALVTHRTVQLLPAVLLLLAGWPSAGISRSADPVIELCLRQYENTLNRLQKVYFEGEATRESISRSPPPWDYINDMTCTVHYTGSFATDGTRFSLRGYRWGHDRGPAKPTSSRKKAQYGSVLWRPDWFHQHNAAAGKPGTLSLAKDPREIRKRRYLVDAKMWCGYVLGDFGSYVFARGLRADRVFRSCWLRWSRKFLDGRPCICLSGTTKYGAFNAYFDEQPPHHLLQLDTVKKPGYVYLKQPLPKGNLIKSTNVFSDYKDFGSVVVPAQCTTVIDHTMPDKMYRHLEVSYRITKLQLVPDFQAMKAFEPTDIREGARVVILGRRGATVSHLWHNPKTAMGPQPNSGGGKRKE